MRPHAIGCATLLAAVMWLAPETASAQYKNMSWGFDAGFWSITKPSLLDSTGSFAAPQNRPLRLTMGGRIGGETNMKLSADHWWASFRLNIGLLSYLPAGGSDAEILYDAQAANTMGLLMAVQGQIGIRYVILTDRFRPYVQAAVSYMPLISFTGAGGNACDSDARWCTGADNNTAAFLRQEHVGGVHLQPGFEWVFKRDMALHVFIDAQLWIVINSVPNFSFVPTIGILFFS